MNHKIVIGAVLVMAMLMPMTHYGAYKHGRITMNEEAVRFVAKGSFVLDGKAVRLQEKIVKYVNSCTICHIRGFNQ